MIEIGKVVSTHGIKGEIKIISNFPLKDDAFKVGSHVFMNKVSYLITSYRRHKNYDMITLEGLNDINQVLPLMNSKVEKDKNELDLKGIILDNELLGMKAYDQNDSFLGEVNEVFYASKSNKLLRIRGNKEFLVPYIDTFVKSMDKKKRVIKIQLIEGMRE